VDVANEVLWGNSFHVLEMDDEDQQSILEVNREYSYLEILENIGKDEFKNIYLNEIIYIKQTILEDQIIFCRRVLEKILEIYNFEFMENINIFEQIDCDNIYIYLEFLEFNHIDFLSFVWNFMGVDLKSININSFCKQNSVLIEKAILEQIDTHLNTWMISEFLRTYNKDDLLEWFVRISQKSRMLVVLKISENKEKINAID